MKIKWRIHISAILVCAALILGFISLNSSEKRKLLTVNRTKFQRVQNEILLKPGYNIAKRIVPKNQKSNYKEEEEELACNYKIEKKPLEKEISLNMFFYGGPIVALPYGPFSDIAHHGIGIEGTLGRNINSQLRTQLQLALLYFQPRSDVTSLFSTTIKGGVGYSYHTPLYSITPYAGCGVQFSHMRFHEKKSEIEKNYIEPLLYFTCEVVIPYNNWKFCIAPSHTLFYDGGTIGQYSSLTVALGRSFCSLFGKN